MTHFLGTVQGLTSDGTNIYAGGTFTEGGSQIADQVARWDGTNWWPVGVSTPGTQPEAGAIALAVGGGYLFAGGNFTSIGSYAIPYVGYWNGTSWISMGAAGQVNAIVYDGTNAWVGGAFISVIGVFSPGLALYKVGTGWSSVGEASGGSRSVNAIARGGGSMYVGGNFTGIGSVHGLVSASNIAVYNYSTGTWSALGSGANGTVSAILVTNGVVYVGGSFTSAGGVAANGIAEWNGSTWSALGNGLTNSSGAGTVNALATSGNTLYAGGTFTNADGAYAAGVAAWNGSTWPGLGSGLYSSAFGGQAGSANALVAIGNDLYVGGNFTSAGNKPSAYFAHWNNQLDYYPTPHPFLSRATWLPGNQFQFRLGGTSGESYILEASTNFFQWSPLLTNSATLYDFSDPNASLFPHRFYRAMLGP
ncbi:MAG: hypothetical protein ACREFR_13235 [Limisphaerales bacterium]